ncbi:MAG: glutamate--cysteine ligase [Parashewanella sp.]
MKPFNQSIAFLNNESGRQALLGIQRGIEREALRVTPAGHLAENNHPKALGSALTHSRITTDYSESLLEFITPVFSGIPELFADLTKTHAFTLKNINGQALWPVSMPCFVNDVDNIPLAQYGTSNVGKLKTLYRKGLTHRYGAQMQVISGVHFNFSVSQELWAILYDNSDKSLSLDEFISESYFGLIRNYRRMMWVLPYLFGASPAVCGSFLDGLNVNLPFSKVGKGSLYLPYATSLRMSDLGYTSKEQESLSISYNSLSEYLEGMNKAIRLPSQEFDSIGVKVDGEYRQLNANVLQIENEFYSPIRAKRVTKNGEKPSEALARAGVEYIEVRALDINPFSPLGICPSQVRFLDLLLLHCLLLPSSETTASDENEISDNLNAVVMEGRKPDLMLKKQGESIALTTWLQTIVNDLEQLAELMDEGGEPEYQKSLHLWKEAVSEPSKTLSGRVLSEMITKDSDHGEWALELSKCYREFLNGYYLSDNDLLDYQSQASESIALQKQMELNSKQGFDQFLTEYFDYL